MCVYVHVHAYTHMYRQDQVHVCVEVRGQLQHCSPNSVHLVGLGFLLFFKIIFVCRGCVYAFNGQKRVALNPLELELQAIVRNSVVAGKMNLGPLQEQQVIFTTEQSPQTHLVW